MLPPILTSKNADACKRMLSAGHEPPILQTFASVTLPGLVELGLDAISSIYGNGYSASIERLAAGDDPVWAPFFREWHVETREGLGQNLYRPLSLEFFRLRDEVDLLGDHFRLFQERFVRSITVNGFEKDYAYALAKILDEMADNIIQHSHRPGEVSTGIVGYHTAPNYAALAIADTGRGVLESLRTNPEWEQLATSADALTAIIEKGASSRQGQGEGEGFKQLFRSLVDRNSVIRLRTGDAALNLKEVPGHRQAGILTVPYSLGVQISICCCLRGNAEEWRIIS